MVLDSIQTFHACGFVVWGREGGGLQDQIEIKLTKLSWVNNIEIMPLNLNLIELISLEIAVDLK